jgi:hypothetical protein
MHRVVQPKGAKPKNQYTITVPAPVARAIVDAGIKVFTVELTEEGVLYRPVLTGPDDRPLPTWLMKGTK